mgnify:FL=1|jgi:hypothetical protein
MVSYTDFRKNKRYKHKSTIMLSDEHCEYFSYGQIFNFNSDGLYFESDFAFKAGIKIKVQIDNPPFQSGPRTLNSVVRWCRELTDYDSDYTYGMGAKFI